MKYFIAITLTALLCCLGCGKSAEKYGDAPEDKALKTAIRSILVSPEAYLGKEIVIEGKITSECPTGGWIRVQDASGQTIYVELHGSPFAPIPQRTGSLATVKGVVFQSEGAAHEVQLIGKGVVIQ